MKTTKTATKSIKELAPTPSEALTAMIAGLLKQSKRRKFKINFDTFGDQEVVKNGKTICYGCAATCTLQELAHKNFVNGEIINYDTRAEYLGFDKEDVDAFEKAINDARAFGFSSLFEYYGIDEGMYTQITSYLKKLVQEPEMPDYWEMEMNNYNWREMIPVMKKVITWLKEQELWNWL